KPVIGSDGFSIYGEADDDVLVVTYDDVGMTNPFTPAAGDAVLVTSAAGYDRIGTVASSLPGSTNMEGKAWVVLSGADSLAVGQEIRVERGASMARFVVVSTTSYVGMPLDANPVESLRVPAHVFGTAGDPSTITFPTRLVKTILSIRHLDQDYDDEIRDGFMDAYSTTIDFIDVFHDSSSGGNAGVLASWVTISPDEAMRGGWVFPETARTTGVAEATLRVGYETEDDYIVVDHDAIYAKPFSATEPVALVYPDTYLPFRAAIDGFVYVPNRWDPATGTYMAAADFGAAVTMTIKVVDMENQALLASETISVTATDAAKYIPVHFEPIAVTPALEGRNVAIIFETASTDGKHAYWENMTFTGWENVIPVCTSPGDGSETPSIEQRAFSSRLLYYYLYDAGRFGLDRFDDPTDNRDPEPLVNDLKFSITSDTRATIGLAEVLDVQLHSWAISDPFTSQDATWADVLAAFGDGPGGTGNDMTYYEFPWANVDGAGDIDRTPGSVDELGSRDLFMRFKVSESINTDPRFTVPTIASGYIHVYDCTSTTEATEISSMTRKITLAITPEHYQQFSEYTRLDVASGSTNLDYASPAFSAGLPLNVLDAQGRTGGLVDTIMLAYRKATSPKNIVLGNWDRVVDISDPTISSRDPSTLIANKVARPDTVDEMLLKPLHKLVEWEVAGTDGSCDVYYDSMQGSNSMVLAPSPGMTVRSSSVTYEVARNDRPIVAVFPDAPPSINGLQLADVPMDEPTLEASTIQVDVYPNRRVMTGRNDLGEITYATVPDFASRFALAPSTLSFDRAVVDATGRIPLSIPTLHGDTGSTERESWQVTIQEHPLAYLQARIGMETDFSPYNGQYFTIDPNMDDISGTWQDDSMPWVIVLKDVITVMGCKLNWYDSMYSGSRGTYDAIMGLHATYPGRVIEVEFDKKDSPSAIASKIYTTLIGHKEFQDHSMIEIDRVGPTLTFTPAQPGSDGNNPTCPTGMIDVEYFDPIWSPILLHKVKLGEIPSPFSIVQVTDGVGTVSGGDGAVDVADGWLGYSLVIRGVKDPLGTIPCGINLTMSDDNPSPLAYAYLSGYSNPASDMVTGAAFDGTKAIAIAASKLDLSMMVDRHRLATM
ncbi:MAG: hypothetical protein GYA24_23480, partial [Candidatus Lokiarchaeota archaeon]|nr:hypothetical protein [Candidatus Lokiarchaeota archaeon]